MRIEVLGPVRLRTDEGEPVEVAERHLRLLMASLVAADGEPVSADTLVERLWPGERPSDPKKVLQAKLSRLRSTLDRARPGGRAMLTHTPAGYRLAVEPDALDAAVFRSAIGRARRMEPTPDKVEALAEALELWRGTPFGEASEELWLQPVVADLHEVRGDGVEALVETLLEQGDPQGALGRVGGAVEDYATREGLAISVMTALYQVGRQHEALELFERLRQRLSEELGVDPTPRLRELHGIILRQDPLLDARAPAAPGRASFGPSNVPAETSPIIGRQDESEQVRSLLTGARLVTLHGVGGVGKTRLAVHVAHEHRARDESGTWFVDLTALGETPEDRTGSGERIASLTATALGLALEAPGGSLLDRLGDTLGTRPVLLVLDNCEHVISEASAFTAQVLRRAPGVRVLATSRELLGLPEEQRHDVGTLATDASGEGPSEAASFFVTRARAADPGFVLGGDNADDVETLCRRLDGLPLALELAAARVRGLSVAALLERLDDRLSLLRRPDHAAPRRQQTLRGMIDWSWSLLDDPERAVLGRLAVHFCTTMDLDAAEAICSDDTEDPGAATVQRAEVIDVLLRLVDRSLVTVTSTPTGVRYGLLESIAAYAREQLDSAGEREATAGRHLRHFRDLALAADAGLRTRRQRHWLARFTAERTQMGLAFDEAIRRGDGSSASALTLATFWFQMCVPGFTMRPGAAGSLTRLDEDLRAVLECPDLPADDRAAVATLVATMEDDPMVMAADIEEALSAFGGESVAKARVQWFAGAALLSAGLRDPGERHVDAALSTLGEHGHDWDLAVAACRRDWLLVTLWREDPRGLTDGRSVSDLLREADAGYGRMYALAVEHRAAELAGDHRRSEVAVTAALELSRELGIESETALWLTASAIAAIRVGDLEGADDRLARARAVSADIGLTNGVAYADFAASMIARYRDDPRTARTLLDRWLALGRGAAPELLTDVEQGFLAVREGDLDAGVTALDRLTSSLSRRAATGMTARVLELAAAVRTLAGDSREAAELLGTAEEVRTCSGLEPSTPEHQDLHRVRERLGGTLSAREIAEARAVGAVADPVERLQCLTVAAETPFAAR